MLLEMAFVTHLLYNSITDPETEMEHHCLIENAIYEAAGEGLRGMRLVTEVVLNRYETEYKSNRTYCGTVYHTLQFSWTRKNKLRQYSREEYEKAAQVVFSYMYGKLDRILPRNTRHYLNKAEATDQSWYNQENVVYTHKNHEFLVVK
jgi:spore germination cell wall hydrolase CwlJ-like protein